MQGFQDGGGQTIRFEFDLVDLIAARFGRHGVEVTDVRGHVECTEGTLTESELQSLVKDHGPSSSPSEQERIIDTAAGSGWKAMSATEQSSTLPSRSPRWSNSPRQMIEAVGQVFNLTLLKRGFGCGGMG